MNDFTKDELELILSDLDHAVFSRYYAEGKAELRKKIQSMIDNYCEHESDGNIYCSNPPKSKCKKCGGFW
jgi:hypothetical protein